jgi:uncharacterized protein (DUF2249 family)
MKINSQTRIAALIKHNPEAIEAIASINPHFNKLKNPVLRAVLAPRVSIADAARIGKCKPEDFFKKLEAIGFEIEGDAQALPISETTVQSPLPDTFKDKIAACEYTSLDVRPILERGTDPFQAIMSMVKELKPGEVLQVINSFEPTPLIKILESKGFLSSVDHQGEVVYTYLLKAAESTAGTPAPTGTMVTREVFESRIEKFGERIQRTDVRALEMPMPMVTILNHLETLPNGYALYVDHKKVPKHLLDELATRNWVSLIWEQEEGEVKLLIFK